LLASSLSDQKRYEKAQPLKVHFPKPQWALHRQKRSQKRGIEFHAIVFAAIQLLLNFPLKLVMPVTASLQPLPEYDIDNLHPNRPSIRQKPDRSHPRNELLRIKNHQKEPMCDHRFFLFATAICFQIAL
jgi:hypothetical protein